MPFSSYLKYDIIHLSGGFMIEIFKIELDNNVIRYYVDENKIYIKINNDSNTLITADKATHLKWEYSKVYDKFTTSKMIFEFVPFSDEFHFAYDNNNSKNICFHKGSELSKTNSKLLLIISLKKELEKYLSIPENVKIFNGESKGKQL